MPKTTYLNLPKEKADNVNKILIDNFYDRHVSQVTVTELVTALGISRGAFYKYFDDIYDAYHTISKLCAKYIHQSLMQAIQENQYRLMDGIETYLVRCAQLDRTSYEWKCIQMLALTNANVYAKRPVTSHSSSPSQMEQAWFELLDKNNYHFSSPKEASYFLFYLEHLVINSLQDYIVNEWSQADLLEDFHYKKKWILQGIIK